MVAEMLGKKYFCYVRILSFKENIFIFNQNKFPSGVFSYKEYMFIQSKINALNEIFVFNDFRSQIWSSICYRNKVKFLYGLYSDFDAYVSHKNKLHLTVSLLRFVSLLRRVKYIFTGSDFALDCRIVLNRGK